MDPAARPAEIGHLRGRQQIRMHEGGDLVALPQSQHGGLMPQRLTARPRDAPHVGDNAQFHDLPIFRAGTPTHVSPPGTFLVTTAPAPMMAWSPMVTPGKMTT